MGQKIMIQSQICPDLLALVILIGLLFLLHNNVLLSKRNTRQFISTSILIIVIIIMEILTIVFEGQPNPNLHISYVIANVIGFTLSPVVIFMMALLYSKKVEQYKYILMIPLLFQAIIGITSPWTGWIFQISSGNVYSRGPYFLLNALTSMYSLIIFILANREESNEYDKREKLYFSFMYFIVIFGSIAQIVNCQMLLIWSSASVSLFLYYIFLREMQFKYDPLTQVRNRKMFEDHMVLLQKEGKATIIVFDINDFKLVNDEFGHTAGDELIYKAAQLIKSSFSDLGTVYRIGGDEFCLLGSYCDPRLIENSIHEFNQQLANEVLPNGEPLSIACGYSFMQEETMTMTECFKLADAAMYKDKKELKSAF